MGQPGVPSHLTDKQPVAKVLETLRFDPNSMGGVEHRWGDVNEDLENPSLVDLLALERTIARNEGVGAWQEDRRRRP